MRDESEREVVLGFLPDGRCEALGVPLVSPLARAGHPDAVSLKQAIDAVMRRAAAGLRWRSPDGEKKKAVAVENGGTRVLGPRGHLVGIAPGPDGHFTRWSDGTRTPAREVADPRIGWKAILEAEGR
ncbi:hypothetical protein WMF30_10290 [Sorangium sp. So ce134]